MPNYGSPNYGSPNYRSPNYGDLQNEIYLAGLSGVVPSLPMSFAELERRAELAMPPGTWSYVAGGAGDEHTQRGQRRRRSTAGAWCRGCSRGADRARPVGRPVRHRRCRRRCSCAPIGVIGICTQDGHGDLATAAAPPRLPACRWSPRRSCEDPMEDVAAEFGDTPGFFQLYTPDRPGAGREPRPPGRARPATAGIVVTLDTWMTGWRPRDLATSNFPQLRGHCLANYFSDPVFRSRAGATARGRPGAGDPGLGADVRQPAGLGRPGLAARR